MSARCIKRSPVGYSGSSTTLVPNIRYAGRSAAFLGGLDEGETVMFAGIAAGGSFAGGGYNSGIGWTGRSGDTAAAPAYITTTVNLPASALGQNIQLRWSVSSDSSVVATGAAGVRIDTISVTSTARVCTPNCGGVRLVTNATLTRVDATTVRANFTVQNTGTATANNVMLTTGRLGLTNGTPLPQALGNIAPGATVNGQIFFVNSTPAASSTLALGGTFTGGTFSSTKRVTIP